MYSRNNRGRNESTIKIPENYGGSILFPNTRMPNPPPVYQSDSKGKAQAPRSRKDISADKNRHNVNEATAPSEANKALERQVSPKYERPWYDGNVIGLRGERGAVEHDGKDEHRPFEERGSCDESDSCEKRDTNDHHHAHEECKEKDSSDQSALAPQSFLPMNLSKHFPFGHGLGFEELFLLGLILVLFQEKADEQIIILLIILLFCG